MKDILTARDSLVDLQCKGIYRTMHDAVTGLPMSEATLWSCDFTQSFHILVRPVSKNQQKGCAVYGSFVTGFCLFVHIHAKHAHAAIMATWACLSHV